MPHLHRCQTHCNGQVVAAGQRGDLANTSEAGSHDNGLVVVLLVVVVDGANALDTRVLFRSVVLLCLRLVPIKNTADKGRNEESASLGSGNGLGKRKHERQVAVDAVLALQNVRRLDTLPSRGNLDENALLFNANLLVKLEDRQPYCASHCVAQCSLR